MASGSTRQKFQRHSPMANAYDRAQDATIPGFLVPSVYLDFSTTTAPLTQKRAK